MMKKVTGAATHGHKILVRKWVRLNKPKAHMAKSAFEAEKCTSEKQKQERQIKGGNGMNEILYCEKNT